MGIIKKGHDMATSLSLEQLEPAARHPGQTLIRLTKWFTIYGSHRIEGMGEGHPCGTTHGHEWKIGVTVGGPLDMSDGTIASLDTIKKAFWSVVGGSDHLDWNRVTGSVNASGEVVGLFVYGQLSCSHIGPVLRSVTVKESPKLEITVGR